MTSREFRSLSRLKKKSQGFVKNLKILSKIVFIVFYLGLICSIILPESFGSVIKYIICVIIGFIVVKLSLNYLVDRKMELIRKIDRSIASSFNLNKSHKDIVKIN